MSYKNEFGIDFDLGFDLSDYPYLNDKSWHNDASPSFYFNVGSLYYVLWVDYSEPSKREDSNCRYLIQEAINEGSENDPEVYSSDGDIIFESENAKELSQFANALFTNSGIYNA
jgi:hypothetical protein